MSASFVFVVVVMMILSYAIAVPCIADTRLGLSAMHLPARLCKSVHSSGWAVDRARDLISDPLKSPNEFARALGHHRTIRLRIDMGDQRIPNEIRHIHALFLS